MNGHTVGSAYFLTFLHVKVEDVSEKRLLFACQNASWQLQISVWLRLYAFEDTQVHKKSESDFCGKQTLLACQILPCHNSYILTIFSDLNT